MTYKEAEKIPAPRSTQTGSVRTHAKIMLRSVLACRPERFAAMGQSDGQHGDDFSGRALGVRQVLFADFFADRDDDPLPADHGSQSERERDGEFHPYRNVLGLLLKSRLVGGQRFRLGRIRDLMLLQKLADRFAG